MKHALHTNRWRHTYIYNTIVEYNTKPENESRRTYVQIELHIIIFTDVHTLCSDTHRIHGFRESLFSLDSQNFPLDTQTTIEAREICLFCIFDLNQFCRWHHTFKHCVKLGLLSSHVNKDGEHKWFPAGFIFPSLSFNTCLNDTGVSIIVYRALILQLNYHSWYT